METQRTEAIICQQWRSASLLLDSECDLHQPRVKMQLIKYIHLLHFKSVVSGSCLSAICSLVPWMLSYTSKYPLYFSEAKTFSTFLIFKLDLFSLFETM